MSDEPEDAPVEKARKLLACQDGTRTARAQAWATLALVEAVDRLTVTVAGPDVVVHHAARKEAERA